MLEPGRTYEEIFRTFHWRIPDLYNIGADICDRHARRSDRIALIYEKTSGEVRRYTFATLKKMTNRLANALTAIGVKTGDRIAIFLPQCPETAISHIAVYKIGGIAVPLFSLFGADALIFRLNDCKAKVIITDDDGLAKIDAIRQDLPDLVHVIAIQGGSRPGTIDFWSCLNKGATVFTPFPTRADDPALIIYTSGTTGPPKGALHAHRTLLGHLPGVELPQNLFPQPGDLFWTPADWAWIGGLIDVLFPSWHHGIPVLAYRARKFDPEFAFHLMAKHEVRNAFLPPTALKMMRRVTPPKEWSALQLRSVGSGGETLGEELLDWGKSVLGITINEFYGQTEANLVVGNCAQLMPVKPGSMGRTIPGHVVEIVDDVGNVLPRGTAGHIAVRRPDPVMFLAYWMNRSATDRKFAGDWCLTGDTARQDEDGYLWFIGRQDDLITSSGYRIGPGEIEDCLLKHPAVAMAGVVGVPDDIRTETVKAFIVLKPEAKAGEALERDIKNFVRYKLAAHEYPRLIEFVESLPMTATGKIIRKDLRAREKGGEI
jgi:acetyl-CoA synthetase